MNDYEQDFPHNNEAEQAVVSSALTEETLLDDLTLTQEHFYNPTYGLLYSTMQRLRHNGTPVDPLTLAEGLGDKIKGVGGLSFLLELSNSSFTTANAQHHAQLIKQSYKARSAIITALNIVNDVRVSGNVADATNAIMSLTDALSDTGVADETGDIEMPLLDLYEKLSSPLQNGVRSGDKRLDDLTGGLQRGDLNIIAARPGMGKTAKMIQDSVDRLTHNDDLVVVIFSLEMSTEMLLMRYLTNLSMINNRKTRDPYALFDERDWKAVTSTVSYLAKLPIKIFDKGGINVNEVKAICRKVQKRYADKQILIYVDYLQLLHGDKKGNREREVSSVSQGLKELAKELDTTVIALAQLSRSVEQRQDKRPMMSDLRESGSIEQDKYINTCTE